MLAPSSNGKRAGYEYATLTYGSQERNQSLEAIPCRIDGFRHFRLSAIHLPITLIDDYFGGNRMRA
jgi:hypothetical protein